MKRWSGVPRGGLFIEAEPMFWEFVTLSGLTDTSLVPTHLRWELELGVRTQLAYRPTGIVREVKKRTPPELAINVRIGWPDRPDGQDRYS